MDGWWLRRWVLMMWRDIISNALSGLDEAVLRRTTKAELDRFRIVEVCHDDLKMEGRAEFHCELEARRFNDLKEEPLRGNWWKGCLISTVGPEDDAAPFLFFEAGTAVFLPREVDIVYL
ncbi:hypothetical protein GOBAR_AA16469 [Gossypium barbadense]|uniref:Agenet domain-containing protein n=1 Tax=Gossypium barbadense TaxID=3634 RepID=A0A2P5XLG0_GOSBA|nr:hypothetical protein GOBAR_AA16469 [Gossypium barbadense]